MRIYIVIPAHNEEAHLAQTLKSLVAQTRLPDRIVIVDDRSTDSTSAIIKNFSDKYPFIQSAVTTIAESQKAETHQPGSKVIRAFKVGFDKLDDQYDLVCKFDADLIFPENYLEKLEDIFSRSPHCGMAGGFCAILENGHWEIERLTGRDHIRGALKCYRKACFQDIGGLKTAMGWDTADEILARYHGWSIETNRDLIVKHLKPTASLYQTTQAKKQGAVFRNLRYGFTLALLGSLKLAFKKRSIRYFLGCISGYLAEDGPYLLSENEGAFLRKYRWKNLGRN